MNRSDRRYSRYLVKGHAFAALSKEYDRVGKIIDISLGGLAFEYLYNERHLSEGLTKINIFLTNNGFHLPNLTCRIICDHPKRSSIENDICTLQKNTCAVQFISLSAFQIDRLDFFIKNYTKGPAP
jgi:hypothetical protein